MIPVGSMQTGLAFLLEAAGWITLHNLASDGIGSGSIQAVVLPLGFYDPAFRQRYSDSWWHGAE